MTSHPALVPFGFPKLDRARAALVRLAEQLGRVRQRAADDEEVGELISRFVSEAYRYITLEETWLKESGYPELEAHLREHQRIIERLADASMDVMKRGPAAVERLCQSIDEDFVEHILGRDGGIARFIATHPDSIHSRV